ncbi:MAG: bifunctional hydroxymethylpyrimidine kinase/phosphomethylpyrimidine kinase, partial [Armatimonadetes bacterium]|nr:bifunctional hydroxymethylpyrimidine kinase/phosphomethylpyrimidine kinase [Armatimonadota bacterium]
MPEERLSRVLTIAGSDSSAGAGIQVDLKVFERLGVYGTTVLTAVTAQNTLGVQKICKLPPRIVGAQIDSVIRDIGADACKIGMLYAPAVVD